METLHVLPIPLSHFSRVVVGSSCHKGRLILAGDSVTPRNPQIKDSVDYRPTLSGISALLQTYVVTTTEEAEASHT